MKLVNMNCPNCGSRLSLNRSTGECECNSCGGIFMLDDEKQHVSFDDMDDAGYEFEMGRQRAREEIGETSSASASSRSTPYRPYTPSSRSRSVPAKKSKYSIWLWVFGWLLFFPIPLTILLNRNNTLDRKTKRTIILIAWVIYLILMVFAVANDKKKDDKGTSDTTGTTVESVVESAGELEN